MVIVAYLAPFFNIFFNKDSVYSGFCATRTKPVIIRSFVKKFNNLLTKITTLVTKICRTSCTMKTWRFPWIVQFSLLHFTIRLFSESFKRSGLFKFLPYDDFIMLLMWAVRLAGTKKIIELELSLCHLKWIIICKSYDV